ncbi:MAG TPA: sugar nucleotide-binding protein [Pirellulales bacterium]|jgi:dTDP-4-dehydrorhamnose reductase|nr:sugar nucleotide-binding protein [Pirellulales bacterium]
MFRSISPPLAPPLPLLITGISGVMGYNALPYFQSKYPGQVFGIRQRDNDRMRGPGILECDADDAARLRRIFDEHRFAAVLDCAGNCNLRSCEINPALARKINVGGAATILDVIAGRAVRLVHLSVDLVFSGDGTGNHREEDPTDPVTQYGKTMVEAEELIVARQPEACILRISLPMGVSLSGHAGAIDWIQSRFKKERPATLYFDEIRTPTYTDCSNELYDAVLASELAGIYHAGGPLKLSLFQVAQVINRVGGYNPACLRGCARIQAGPIPPRAGNVTMDSSKLCAAIGYRPFDPWPAFPEFVPSHPEWHFERTGFTGSPELLAEVLYRNPRRLAAEPS